MNDDFMAALDAVLPKDTSEDALAPKGAPARQPSLEEVWSNFTKHHPDLDVDAIVSAIEEIREYSPEVAAQLSPGDLLEVALAYDQYAVGEADVVGGLQSLQGNDAATIAFVQLAQPDPDELHAVAAWIEDNVQQAGMEGVEKAQQVVESAVAKYGEAITTDIARNLIAQADPQTPEELEAILRFAASASEEEQRAAQESAFDRAFMEATGQMTPEGEDKWGNRVPQIERELDFDRIAEKAGADDDSTRAYKREAFLQEFDRATGQATSIDNDEVPLTEIQRAASAATKAAEEQRVKDAVDGRSS